MSDTGPVRPYLYFLKRETRISSSFFNFYEKTHPKKDISLLPASKFTGKNVFSRQNYPSVNYTIPIDLSRLVQS